MILFLLGIAITLNVIFGLIIYFFLITDYSLKNKKKKKQELDILNIESVDKKNGEKIDISFWG